MKRWPARLAALIATAIAAVAATATPAHAVEPVDYVALGDSYSSGTGAPPYQDIGCLRSSRSYAALWASTHAVSSFAFAACGGATTSDVLNSQLGALNANTDLVTITIGGNDVGFASVMTACTLGGDSTCINAVNQAMAEAQTILPARLDATYAAIRAAAPNALVIVLGYPRLVSPTGSCGLFNLSSTKRAALNNGADVLDAVIADRVAAAGPGFVYQSAIAHFDGHGACGPSPWINRFSLLQIVESYHPNATGYSAGYLPLVNAITG
jgi:lysophospholipase L1-like esterase